MAAALIVRKAVQTKEKVALDVNIYSRNAGFSADAGRYACSGVTLGIRYASTCLLAYSMEVVVQNAFFLQPD